MKKGKNSFYARYIKRLLDIVLSFLAIVLLSPLFVVLTVTGAAAMGGNPFFVQKRPGRIDKRSGRESIFSLVKFRSMNNKTDAEGNLLPDDMRLTGYGLFLRKTSLDELPELFNILRGDLSVCGPRPLLISYLPYFTEEERRRHEIRPGLTGWAQVHGRNNVSWDERLRLDIEYINSVSFSMDVKIIGMTVKSVLKTVDIAENTHETEGNFAEIRRAQQKNLQT